MRIRLLEPHRIYLEGISKWHKRGEEIEAPDPLAQGLIGAGVAVRLDKPKAEEPKASPRATRKQEYR